MVAILAADHLDAGDVPIGRAGVGDSVFRLLDPALAVAGGLECHPCRAAALGQLLLETGGVQPRQAAGLDHQLGGGACRACARDVVAPAHEHDLVTGIGPVAGLDGAAGHLAADKQRVTHKGRGVDQGAGQAAVQARLMKRSLQLIVQHGRSLPRRQHNARRQHGLQFGGREGEIPVAVLEQHVALRAGMGDQHVVALIAAEHVGARTALEHVRARAADQGEIAGVIRGIQRDGRVRMVLRADGGLAVDAAVILQRHGADVDQRDFQGDAIEHARQHHTALLVAELGVAGHAADVLGRATAAQRADHQIVAAAAADAIVALAVGHGNDVAALTADDIVVPQAADDVVDVQHAGQAAGVIQGRGAILIVQVDGDVVFIAAVVQRGLAVGADKHLDIELVHQRGRAAQVADAAIAAHAGAQVDGDAALGMHLGGKVGVVSGEIQRVAALAALLGEGEALDAVGDDVGVVAAAAFDDVLLVVDGDHRVTDHRNLVAAPRRTDHTANVAHIAESGRRRRRDFLAIAALGGAGQVYRDTRRVAAVVQDGLAVERGADQVEGLAADLQDFTAVGRLEHHIDDMVAPVALAVLRLVGDLIMAVIVDDGRDIALDGREIQRVVAVLVIGVAHPDAVFLLHALAQLDRADRGGGVVVEHEGVVAAVADQRIPGCHAGQRTAAIALPGDRRHQAVPARHGHRGGLDGATAIVQHPVAAQRSAAHRVGCSGHVGTRDGRQAVHEGHAPLAGCHIAAIKHEIAVIGQRIAPGAQLVFVAFELALPQRGRTQRELTGLAVAHDLHGRQIAMLRQDLGDLLHTVVAPIEHDDFGIVVAQYLQLRAFALGRQQSAQALGLAADQTVEPLHQLLGVIHRGIDEDDLTHLGRRIVAGVAFNAVEGRVRALCARQPGLGIALARLLGLGILVQGQRLAQRAGLLERGALDQIGVRPRRTRFLALRPRLHRGDLRRLVFGGRRRRHHQLGRHQVTALQRLEERAAAEQGLLHLTRGATSPEFACQFLQAHIVTRYPVSPGQAWRKM
ncbi:Uncharacterised protein [Bordetella trematum]|nr:Uncharacterised protein [Bordetella trematum]